MACSGVSGGVGSYCVFGEDGVASPCTSLCVFLSSLVESSLNKTCSRSEAPLSAVTVMIALLWVSGAHTFEICACSDERSSDCSGPVGPLSRRSL